METVQKSLRLTLALVGRTNAGKSTLLNVIAGQDVAITSPQAGTTTDVVEKAMELLPVGPILLLDTAGFDDASPLGLERVRKTRAALQRADVIVRVCDGPDAELEAFVRPFAKPGFALRSRDFDPADRESFLKVFIPRLIEALPPDALAPMVLVGDLVQKGQVVLQVIPIDSQAPKGRVILPQMNLLREALDCGFRSLVVTEADLQGSLKALSSPPALAVCDSQVVHLLCREMPRNVPCTTYSILMARAKGDLKTFVAGARAIDTLRDGARLLIAESCSHHAGDEDIGRVKIPNWIRAKKGINLSVDVAAGRDFPEDLSPYHLVIQCGGCMTNRAQILWRIAKAREAGIPITNYGVAISHLQGVLPRVLEPFRALLG